MCSYPLVINSVLELRPFRDPHSTKSRSRRREYGGNSPCTESTRCTTPGGAKFLPRGSPVSLPYPIIPSTVHVSDCTAFGNKMRCVLLYVGVGGGLPVEAVSNAMLCLPVYIQTSFFRVRCAVWVPAVLSLLGLKCCLLPHHPYIVCFVRLPTDNFAGLAQHSHNIIDIFLRAHMVKHPREDVNRPLEPFCLFQHEDAVIRVKK